MPNPCHPASLFAAVLTTLAVGAAPRAQSVCVAGHSVDPLAVPLVVPDALRAAPGEALFCVQAEAPWTDDLRAAVTGAGLALCRYVPEQAYLVRGPAAAAAQVAARDGIRWVGPWHPAFRLAPELLCALDAGTLVRDRYVLVLTEPVVDAAPLARAIERVGGTLELPPGEGLVAEATLTPAQLLAVARADQVCWIEPAGAIELDMDLVRILGGATFLESIGGHTGKGVRGHVLEAVHATHPEFAANPYRSAPIPVVQGGTSAHGTATFGVMFAAGLVPKVRGVLPDGQGLYTDLAYVINQSTRHSLVGMLVDPAQPYRAMFQSAAWGYPRTNAYTARSAEMDQILFDHDLPITQPTGNSPGNVGRPTAWAKNIIAVAGYMHFENLNFADDCWCNTSAGGPTTDGRIKPELSHHYDSIDTVGGGPTGYASFGGTSGSTSIVAGFVGLAIELFTDGAFGYPAAPGWQSRFDYTPHFTTTKALLVNTARQHAFSGANHDMARNHQGWGMPDVAQLWRQRDGMLVIDELDVLRQGETQTYWVWVPPGTPELRVTMTHAEPPAMPAANPTRINSVDLAVTAPDGQAYWGNFGLEANMFSLPGGTANDVDTLENVWLASPPSGVARIDVRATAVRQDAHVQTAAFDVDYALVTSGTGGLRDRSAMELRLDAPAPGQLDVQLLRAPSGFAGGYTLFSLATHRPLAAGHILGLEPDALTAASLGAAMAVGNPFHFAATGAAGAYPNAPFRLPAAVAVALSGTTLDAVGFVYDAQGRVQAVSNVARVTVP